MSRGTKLAVAAAAACAAALVAYRIHLALLPDEARIRGMVEGIRDAFNEERAGGISRHLADDFEESASGLGRREVHAFLAQFFLTQRTTAGDARFSVEVPDDGIEVRIDEPPATARLEVRARFRMQRSSGDAIPYSTMLFTAELAKVDGEWLIRRARQKTLEGRSPF